MACGLVDGHHQEGTLTTHTAGLHLLAEYHHCDSRILDDQPTVAALMERAVLESGATIVKSVFHRFSPQGVSGVVVIQESHLSVHTWPETGYAAVDFYTCGDLDPRRAHPILAAGLGAQCGELMLVNRGVPEGPMRMERLGWDGARLGEGPRSGEALLPAPTTYFLVSGAAEGPSTLNAFDHALLDAGIGDTNLVRMSSILPPGVRRTCPHPLPPGALVPVAYARKLSERAGETIAAAVAIALPEDPALPGLIMEHHGAAPLAEISSAVRTMAIAGMEHRRRPIRDVVVEGAEHRVVGHGCAFAAVVLWHDAAPPRRNHV